MRKSIIGIMAFVLILLICLSARPAQGDGWVEPYQPWSGSVSIENLSVIYVNPVFMVYPEVNYHHVTVEIDEGYVVTEVDQEFYNPNWNTMEGTYIFPVPEGAVISDFELIIDGTVHKPQVIEKEEAAEFLREAVREGRDASLLEYTERNLFTYKVSIPAHENQKICLRYEEVVPMVNGEYRYIYTLGTERYSSSMIDHISVDILIRSENGIRNVHSTTHDVKVSHEGFGSVMVSYELFNARPDTDMELYYSKSREQYGGNLQTHREEGEEEGHFMFLFSPEIGEKQEWTMAKDIMIVVDSSGSMEGEKMDQVKESLGYILQQLNEYDRFNIITFNDHVARYSDVFEAADNQEIRRASAFVDTIVADGGTNIDAALGEALYLLKRSPDHGALRIVLFLTDGKPTTGNLNANEIINEVRHQNDAIGGSARIFSLGIGHHVNARLLGGLSSANRGWTILVEEHGPIDRALLGLFEEISSPVLTDVTIEFLGVETYDVFPSNIPDVFLGTQITVVGKYSGHRAVAVIVRGRSQEGTKEYEYNFIPDRSTNVEYVPRIWATRKIESLLDIIWTEGETQTLVDEVMELGKEYGLVTPYTSMVVDIPFRRATFDFGIDQTYLDITINDNTERLTDDKYLGNGFDTFFTDEPKRNVDIRRIVWFTDPREGDTVTTGENSFMILNGRFVDLSLIPNALRFSNNREELYDWFSSNVRYDRIIIEGSDEYTALYEKERNNLPNEEEDIVLSYKGEVILITTEQIAEYQETVHGVEWIETPIYSQFSDPGDELEIGLISVDAGEFVLLQFMTSKPATGLIKYREIGIDGYFRTLYEGGVGDQGPTIHQVRGYLDPGDYEFYIVSTDEYGFTYKEDNEGSLFKFTIPPAQIEGRDDRKENAVPVFDGSFLFVSGILLMAGIMMWVLWTQRSRKLDNIDTKSSLIDHIGFFSSDLDMVLILLQRLMKLYSSPYSDNLDSG